MRRREQDADKPAYAALYNCTRWKAASRLFRAQHPLCSCCSTLGEVVDHIVPHKGNLELFWNAESNWQTLCFECHNRKSASERRPVWDRASP